jgi:hypothetical protein
VTADTLDQVRPQVSQASPIERCYGSVRLKDLQIHLQAAAAGERIFSMAHQTGAMAFASR